MTLTATPAPSPAAGPRVFGFRLPPITHAILILFGVTRPPTVTLDATRISVRFGFYRSNYLLSDVARFEIDGPYTWWRALAVRHTFFKTDISYCTDERGAVRLYLRSLRRVHWARTCDQVYLGVQDLDGLAEALRGLGISGEDRRTVT